MKKYINYNIENFAADDYFIDWCLEPNDESNTYWNNFLEEYPQFLNKIEEAKLLVLAIQSIEKEENELDFENEIWDKIDSEISKEEQFPKRRILRKRILFSAISSAAAVLLVLSIYFVSKNYTQVVGDDLEFTSSEWINFENNSGIAKSIQLADKSTVLLEPFSTLKYPRTFSGDQRTVFLKGEAFFDIQRDTMKPFLVYANETITKVLGTSFKIKAFEGQKTVEVDVKTGKVAVYAKVDAGKDSNDNREMVLKTDVKVVMPLPNKKLEVTPNQKVIFNKVELDMIRTVSELPTIITQYEEISQFEFKNEPVVKVFEALESAYGIELKFDEKKLENCNITTKLNDEPLLQKLNIICIALGLEYVEKDAIVYINGEGC